MQIRQQSKVKQIHDMQKLADEKIRSTDIRLT